MRSIDPSNPNAAPVDFSYHGVPVGSSSSSGWDASGTRIAKGAITAWSYDPARNITCDGQNQYLSGGQNHDLNNALRAPGRRPLAPPQVVGLGGEQLTEMGIGDANSATTSSSASSSTTALTWQHANIWAGGKLLGTYDKDGLHFYFDDPLGTRRAQTDAFGVIEQTCSSLPYGDALACSSQPDNATAGPSPYLASLYAPTEHHFTAKERDAESGNDYFEARYYNSAMGRFMSPDAVIITATRILDPQGLNLYSYARNHPLIAIDVDGNMTIVITVNSDQTSTQRLYSDQYVLIGEYNGLARGSGRNRMSENGDTPYGRYLFSGTQGGTMDYRGLGPSYGTGIVRMTPDFGEALDSGRTGVATAHGGGKSKNPSVVPNPYAEFQRLIGTHGCGRLTNHDVNRLIGDIHSLETNNGEKNVGDSVYVGDENTLRFMGGLKNSDGTPYFQDLYAIQHPLSNMGIDTSFSPSSQPAQQGSQTDTSTHEANQ